jgi:hypothetical protein
MDMSIGISVALRRPGRSTLSSELVWGSQQQVNDVKMKDVGVRPYQTEQPSACQPGTRTNMPCILVGGG